MSINGVAFPSLPSGAVHRYSRSDRYFLVLLLAVAFGLRLYLASATTYLWDEERDWIPMAESISLRPGSLDLPLRADYHGALSAYFIKVGSILLGSSPLGFRFMGVVAGTLTILLVFQMAFEWAGPMAARWAAILLAFNEYHIQVSVLALEKTYYLLFAIAALWAFRRFFSTQNTGYLYLAAAAAGIAFLCKELAVLLLPVFFLALLFSKHRSWLTRREPYFALLLFVFVIAPDLYGNLRGGAGEQIGYGEHLSRVGGLGLSEQPLAFYARYVMSRAYRFLGSALPDTAPEYYSMNVVFGGFLFWAVVAVTIRHGRKDAVTRCLLFLFWLVFGFFTLIRPGAARRPDLDAEVWFWVDMTLLPAVLLAGWYVSRLRRPWHLYAVYALLAVASLRAVLKVTVSHLAMPSVAVRCYPERLWPPAGQMVNVGAQFNYCTLCDANPRIELLGIDIVERRGRERWSRPGIGTADVAEAQLHTDDRTFALRATLGPGDRRYLIMYRVTESSGTAHVVSDVIRLGRPGWWRQPFWRHNGSLGGEKAHH